MTDAPTSPVERALALVSQAQELHDLSKPNLAPFLTQQQRDEIARDQAPAERDHALAVAQLESLLAIAEAIQDVVDTIRPAVEVFTSAPLRVEFHRLDDEGRPVDEETTVVPVTRLRPRDDRQDRKPTDPTPEGA